MLMQPLPPIFGANYVWERSHEQEAIVTKPLIVGITQIVCRPGDIALMYMYQIVCR